jgi:hypothetical protein
MAVGTLVLTVLGDPGVSSASTPLGNGDLPVIEVTLDEYSFTMPEALSAGAVRIEATNAGEEDHQLTLGRIRDGYTTDDVFAAAAESESAAIALLEFYAAPNAVRPGATEAVEVELPPGTYLALCLIPAPDGAPHLAHGMLKVLTVGDPATTSIPPDASVELPMDDVEGQIHLFDYGFGLPDGFDGNGRFSVTNDAEQAHEVTIYRIGDGGSYDDFAETVEGGGNPDPLVYPGYGGVTTMDPGGSAIVELQLPPGEYVFICFVPDTGDEAPHFAHGMIQPVTIG